MLKKIETSTSFSKRLLYSQSGFDWLCMPIEFPTKQIMKKIENGNFEVHPFTCLTMLALWDSWWFAHTLNIILIKHIFSLNNLYLHLTLHRRQICAMDVEFWHSIANRPHIWINSMLKASMLSKNVAKKLSIYW